MITPKIYIDETGNCAMMFKKGGYRYGDSHATPPCADGVTACDRGAVARPLYNLGKTDQPQGGITVVNMEQFLVGKWKFKKITKQSDLKAGDIVLMKKNGQTKATWEWHTFLLTAYNAKTQRCDKYDFGSQKRIDAGGFFKNVPLNEWEDSRSFYCGFRLPDEIKRIKPKGQKYVIESAVDKNYAIDVYGATLEPQGNIQLYKKNGTQAQTFVCEDMKNGYVRIVNIKSGLVVDVYGGKAVNKRNIWQYEWNGTKAQLWKIQKNSDGSVTFRSAINNEYVIDLYAGKAQNKQNINLYKANGTKAQKWFLRKV